MASKIFCAFRISCYPCSYRGSHLLLDREGLVVGVLMGQPKDTQSWSCVHAEAFVLLRNVASRLSFSDQECSHRRGLFPSIAHGLSFGGGQQVCVSVSAINLTKSCCQEPQYLSHRTEKREEEMEVLMNQSSIQRICKFASSTLPSPTWFDMMNHIF
jgi:hypothetical protein